MIYSLEHNMVPMLSPCPMAGATSHFTIIGTIFQTVVENLFLATMVYALRPGFPVLWGGASAALDMQGGDVSYGGIERSLMLLANTDMAVYYGIPGNSPAGSLDSCLIDCQAGAEKTWTFMTRLLSQAASGIVMGAVTNGKAMSAEQLVIDADIVKCVLRYKEGIDVGHLDQSIKELKEVGPAGNFLEVPSTLELLRGGKEYFYPKTFNMFGTDASPMLEKAHEEVESLLYNWRSPVPENIQMELGKRLKLSEVKK